MQGCETFLRVAKASTTPVYGQPTPLHEAGRNQPPAIRPPVRRSTSASPSRRARPLRTVQTIPAWTKSPDADAVSLERRRRRGEVHSIPPPLFTIGTLLW
jgi:hypothetical protein